MINLSFSARFSFSAQIHVHIYTNIVFLMFFLAINEMCVN